LVPRLGISIGEDEQARWRWRQRRLTPPLLPQLAAIVSRRQLKPERLPQSHWRRGSQGEEREMKYVVVTGGVVSGLGKGVTASSIGVVLKACGLRVTSIKIGEWFFFFPLASLPFYADFFSCLRARVVVLGTDRCLFNLLLRVYFRRGNITE